MLVAPVVIFLFHVSSLEFSEDIFREYLDTFSTLSVSENTENDSNSPNSAHELTVIITEEQVSQMLHAALMKQTSSIVTVNSVHVEVSPEGSRMEISYLYGISGYWPFETTIFSDWLIRTPLQSPASNTSVDILQIKPVNIHTNHLYSVDWAEFWPSVSRSKASEGWVNVRIGSGGYIRKFALQEHEFSLNLSF